MKRTIDPNGRVVIEETTIHNVDPSLLRTLSTHHDRRNRHALNQASPDAAQNAIQVNVLQDFMAQGDGGNQKLSASEWNNRQGSIDV